MNRRAAIYGELARLFAELAEIEAGAVPMPPPPKSSPRRRARPARVPSLAVVPPLDDLDAAHATRIRDGVAQKLRIHPR